MDDWFDEPETPDSWTARVDRLARARRQADPDEAEVDDWIRDSARAEPVADRRIPPRAVLGLSALAVAALLGVLAAAGVFSSSPKTAAPPTIRTHVTPPTTTSAVVTVPSLVPAAPLKPGDTGAEVKKLQRALARAGYSPGAVDGSYGAATTTAVTHFQQAQNLTADGIAGSKTLAALKNALEAG